MIIKIWGVRGSTPSPIRSAEIKEKIITSILSISKLEPGHLRDRLLSVLLAEDKKNIISPEKQRNIVEEYLNTHSPILTGTVGGNTPCIEVRVEDELFIIDAGSGIRELGQKLMEGKWGRGEGTIRLFFSHPHWDHIQGFPFFRPAFVAGNKIFIYSVHDMETALHRQQEAISFPIPLNYMEADIKFIQITPEEVLEFGNLRIRNIRNHHPGEAYSYRFEKENQVFVYASDAAYPTHIDDQPYVNFFANADLLIFDAHFIQRESDEKEDWGHSSSFVGVEMAQRANVKKLLLFHYDPAYPDEKLTSILDNTLKFQQNQYPNHEPVKVLLAQEGQIFDLTPSQTTQLQKVPGGKIAILKPTVIFDQHVVANLRYELDNLLQDRWPLQLIIDMSKVELLQIAGLRALVKLRREQQGLPMVLAGPPVNVQQLIDLAGYSDFFAVYPSVHNALSTLKARETLNLPGQIIKNRYHIETKMGDGRLGTVFKAVDMQLKKPVALKILSPSFSEGAIEQFLHQARQIIDLSHPNIVQVYDCDEDGGLSFMVEEFIEGKTLRDMLNDYQSQPLPIETALSITESITQALQYAHTHSVTHGDLKPKNVLLADKVKISDFGLGRLESGKSILNIDVPLALVTAEYVAPEQILGHPIDARTDLYALGIILYELFTGKRPFEGTDEEVLEQHRNKAPVPPRQLNPKLSRSIEHLILKLLDKDPNRRYANAHQVRRILNSLETPLRSTEEPSPIFDRQFWPMLVGRGESLQTLLKLWSETQQGHGQLVFITGEVGVGKTRLVQELIQYARNATLLMGCGQSLAKNSAYHPFKEALRTYFNTVSSESLVRHLGPLLSEMGHFMPSLHPSLAEISPQPPSSIRFVSLAKLIKQATREGPWLIIMDDLQGLDPHSMQLLHYLARHCQEMALMIVALYQSERRIDNPVLLELIDDLRDLSHCTSLTLNNLSHRAVNDLLGNLWSETVPDSLVTVIERRTKGNPLYVEEIARSLANDGLVRQRDGQWRFTSVVEVSLPQNIREAIAHRLNRLSKETHSLLQQAAVLGITFKFEDLHEMSDLSAWDALESLDIAMKRQFLREIPGAEHYRFRHLEVQQVLYHGLNPLKRQLLHREAAEALERRYQTEPESVVEQLAYHFLQAKDYRKGLLYSHQAAQQAEKVQAPQTALFWYHHAMEALNSLTQTDSTINIQWLELLLGRERIYHLLGKRQAQAADLDMAKELTDPNQRAMIHNRRAELTYLNCRFDEASLEAQEGLMAARQMGDSSLEGESLFRLAHIAASQGDLEVAQEQMQSAQQILSESNDQHLEAKALRGLGSISQTLNNYAQAATYYQQSLSLSQTIGSWTGQASSLNSLGRLYLEIGDYTKAISVCQRALEMGRTIGYQRGIAMSLGYLALVYGMLGDYSSARRYIDQALSLWRAIEDPQGEITALRTSGLIHRATSAFSEAWSELRQALEKAQRLKLPIQEAKNWLELGLTLEMREDWDKAKAAFREAHTLYHNLGRQHGDMDACAGRVRCLMAQDEIDIAGKEIKNLLKELDAHGPAGLKYPGQFYLTAYRVLQALEEPQAAAEVLQTGQNLLRQRAEQITPHLRMSYLEKIASHKELLGQVSR